MLSVMTDSTQRMKGILLTALGVLVLTPDALLVRLIQTDAWTLFFWRGLLQCVALMVGYVVVFRTRTVQAFIASGWTAVVIGFIYAVSNTAFTHSIRMTSASNTLLIISSAPLIAAVLSRLFLREKTAWYTWLAAMMSLLGVAIIFSGERQATTLSGDLMALVSAVCMAGSFVLIRYVHLVNMIPAVAISGLIMAILVAPLAPSLVMPGRDMLYLFLLGAVITPIAFGLITLGPRYISAPEVSLLMLIETVLGPTWVWLILGEIPSLTTFMGGVVVLTAIIGHSVIAMHSSEDAASRRSALHR